MSKLRFGNITEVNPDNCYARVKFTDDEIVSAPLQILVRAALVDKDSFTFEINEQVAVIMDDNSEEGVILGAIFNDKTKPDGGGTGIFRMLFGDGTFMQYDKNTHKYEVNVKGDVAITAEGDVSIEAETASVTATTVEVDAQQVSVDADTVVVDAMMMDFTGILNLTGDMVVSGSIAAASITAPVIGGGGGVSIENGNIDASGEVKGATVKAGPIDLATHKHTGVTTGSGTSGPATP